MENKNMRAFLPALGKALWTGLFAIVLTAASGALWSALLLFNLKVSPAIPWSAVIALGLSGLAFAWLGGKWAPARTQSARKTYLRATPVRPGIFATAIAAGALGIIALAGFWIVLFQLVKMPGNSSDFSKLPTLTVAALLATSALIGAVFEEAGFRGYFQGTLERYVRAPVAILMCALVMAPEHAATQGFVWPTMLFYLLVDVMLGASAALTKSILPGVVVHAIGLAVFFGIVWPADQTRALVWQHGADIWFWLHAGQTILFGLASVLLFVRLARGERKPARSSALPSAT
jgi:membrane protease YdiL (CAAX protease family)